MRINHNIPALRTLHQMNKTNNGIEKTMQRLSSGLRITGAADDAAGLAISQKMHTQIRGLQQANRNSMDGISLIQTAEGALEEVHSMLQRTRELSIQAANGTLTNSDREAISLEVSQLKEEIDRISDHIEYNEKKLLNGDIDRKSFSNDNDVAKVFSMTDEVSPGDYTFTVKSPATKTKLDGSIYSLFDVDKARESGNISINGEDLEIKKGDDKEEVLGKLSDLAELSGIDMDIGENKITLTHKEYGPKEIEIKGSLASKLGLAEKPAKGKDIKVEVKAGSGFPQGVTQTSKGNIVSFKASGGFELKVRGTGTKLNEEVTLSILKTGPLDLQIGANEGQMTQLRIPNMSSEALGLKHLGLQTAARSQEAISLVDSAIEQVSAVRSKLGAYQNRLEHTVANLDVAAENMTSSMSRIQDADMAKEMSTYTKDNILAQAGNAMLAQANQRPQQILQLLQ